MRIRWLILALVFSAMVNVVAIGTIGYHWWRVRRMDHPSPPPPPESMLRPLRRSLSLTPEQMQELEAQRRRISEEIREMRRDLAGSRTRLMQVLRSADPDSMAAEEILQDIASSQIALERKVIHSILRMRKVLTPEQREELLRMIERRGGWHTMGPKWEHGMRQGPFGPGRPSGTDKDKRRSR